MTSKAVLSIAFATIALCSFAHAQEVAAEAVRTGHWTNAEQKEFQGCVARLEATKKPNDTSSSEAWCEVWEEHSHWLHGHPELKGKKEIPGRFSKCNRAHSTEINGTPQQFWAAMDRCWREAYGLALQSGKE
jgi:hypothetical protein